MLSAIRSRANSLYSSSLRQPWLWNLNHSSFFTTLTLDKHGKTEILKLEEIEKVLTEVRADDVKIIPVADLCDLTDYMVFATGRSSWHVRNIAQALVYKAKQKQKEAKRMLLPSVEGKESGNWIVVDSGSVIVHALDEKARAYYDLESRWSGKKPPADLSQDLHNVTMKVRPKNNSKKRVQTKRH
ncbi:protein Iojap-related, mitochondrial [Beta vulgaris subsp. vulgaris]|uniref:protein Iojap-related, mitochondrial n=1 Tax=Beta vulgaris subsp. vulgaris TaxID=3555 RepID=UPI00203734DB|nr:protein Iojap-related, mitochondrial [Beta vulgaris subsp. vulgaris]